MATVSGLNVRMVEVEVYRRKKSAYQSDEMEFLKKYIVDFRENNDYQYSADGNTLLVSHTIYIDGKPDILIDDIIKYEDDKYLVKQKTYRKNFGEEFTKLGLVWLSQ